MPVQPGLLLLTMECDQKPSRGGREIIPPSPNCHFLTIARHGVDIFCVQKPQPDDQTDQIVLKKIASFLSPGTEIAEWSPLGNLMGVGVEDSLLLIDPKQSFKEIGRIRTGQVKKMYFSPKGTYAVVLTSPATNEQNLRVYRLSDQSIVASFALKGLAAQERWPPLIWSRNETYCFRLMANGIDIFPSDLLNFPTPTSRISAEKVKAFAPSPELADGSINVAVFTPTTKDRPASCRVFSMTSPSAEAVPLNNKSFFQVQDITLEWNCSGTAVLAIAHTDVDNSGKSYYGTSSLYFVEAGKDGRSLQVVGGDKGPVSDCKWSPTANEFIAINGPIPPSVNLNDGRTAEPKLSFGNPRRNTIRFSPFGRFILLAGFGNLAGDFDIWDKNKKKIIGSGKAQCSVDCEWAPDGRMFLCATTAPRMRVDNCVKIFRYNGDLLVKEDIPDLYFAKWMPCEPGTHPDRGTSRGRTIGAAALPADAPKVYRPPKANEAFEARMRAQNQTEVRTTATVVKSTTLPPGADCVQPISKSAKKNAARRAKKQKD